MGVPGADVRYVLESLGKIEAALCNGREDELRREDFIATERPNVDTALELLRELQAELEAIK